MRTTLNENVQNVSNLSSKVIPSFLNSELKPSLKSLDIISNKPVINELPHTVQPKSIAIPKLVENVSISPVLSKTPFALSPLVNEKFLNTASTSGLDVVKEKEIKKSLDSPLNVSDDMSLKSVFNKVKTVVGKVLPIATTTAGAIFGGPAGAAGGASIGVKLGGALTKANNAVKAIGVLGMDNNQPKDLAPVAQTPSAAPSKALGVLRSNSPTFDLATVLAANQPNFSENADRPGLVKNEGSSLMKIGGIILLIWLGCKAFKIC